MKKSLLAIILLLLFGSIAVAEEVNTAVPFEAYPGFYVVGTDFPSGTYEIHCSKDTSQVNVVIKDADENILLNKGFSSDANDWISKIRLLDKYEVQISDGTARFAPSAGGIIFDESQISTPSSPQNSDVYKPLVVPAIELLKEQWKANYTKDNLSKNGYLEIKNTRIIWINDGLSESESNSVKQYFSNVDYIVDFILYTDYFGSEPYYSNTWLDNCVIVYTDGTKKVARDQLDLYRSRSYNSDYSEIIKSIIDLGSEYNASYRLLNE